YENIRQVVRPDLAQNRIAGRVVGFTIIICPISHAVFTQNIGIAVMPRIVILLFYLLKILLYDILVFNRKSERNKFTAFFFVQALCLFCYSKISIIKHKQVLNANNQQLLSMNLINLSYKCVFCENFIMD